MSGNTNLPPEAYTREVLIKAYDWLSNQSASVRARATSADSLVALFLQAKRRNFNEHGSTQAFEPPTAASVEAFKEDLRNLAEGLRQFDDPFAPPPQPAHATPTASATSPLAGYVADWNQPTPTIEATRLDAPRFEAPRPSESPRQEERQQPPRSTLPVAPGLSLDPRTREWVQEVQRRLNLTSETEALRALVAVGYERLRDILPQA